MLFFVNVHDVSPLCLFVKVVRNENEVVVFLRKGM